MFPSKTLLSFVLISLSVVGASPMTRTTGKATLSFATRFNTEGSLNIAERDRARAQALKNVDHLGKRNGYVNVTNAVVTYIAQVGVGEPATNYNLIIDTGSSNTWVGADSSKPYVRTKSSNCTGGIVHVMYGSGQFVGLEYSDTVTLGPDLVIKQQSIGVAKASNGFDGVDGILGVGPVNLTEDTVSNMKTVPTVTDNLLSQKTISEEVLGIYYVPAYETKNGGKLTFGGVDYDSFEGPMQYVNLTATSPASDYWGIDQHIYYGDQEILSHTAGIVDTGTTLILIATDAFNAYQTATGATLDPTTGLLMITSDQYENLKSLTFYIGGRSYELTPNAQIWPRSLNAAIGGNSGSIYLVVNDIGSNSGSGLDFIDGYTFLERYYSVFDTSNGQVGFANTAYTYSESN